MGFGASPLGGIFRVGRAAQYLPFSVIQILTRQSSKVLGVVATSCFCSSSEMLIKPDVKDRGTEPGISRADGIYTSHAGRLQTGGRHCSSA